MAQTKPLLSGVLYKRGAGGMIFGRRNWKLRYFELTTTKLQYFTSTKRRKLRGELLLVGDDTARFKLEMMPPDQMKHSQTSVVPKWRFVVYTPERELLLAAFSETEMKTWVHHLGMVFPKHHEIPPIIVPSVRKAIDTQRTDSLTCNAAPQQSMAYPVVVEDSLHGSFTLDFSDQNHVTFNADGYEGTPADRSCEFTQNWAGEGDSSVYELEKFRGSSITANEYGFPHQHSRFWSNELDLRRASESSVAFKTFRSTERFQQRSSMVTSVTL